uniref:T6SS Transcription factor RovC-like DNA binding domain-containing protein n=1 Tax=Rhodopseudomonas palustris (strain BisA53) TaxID=316055 RepID=Q07JC2_RHOP5
MRNPELDPDVADVAPVGPTLTSYDQEHLVTYLRLLDADAEDADWQEVAKIVLHIDPACEQERARRAYESHLARAKWMTESGYRYLLRPNISE